MGNVYVITGGGSGMGLEAAKIVGKNGKVILVGRTVSKLENAIQELKALGTDAEAYPADAGNRESVKALAQYAKTLGTIKAVIHSAGVSPHMADGKKIFEINACGTINVDEEMAEVMEAGSCILNVSSMSGYMLPAAQTPYQLYQLSLSNQDAFKAAANQMIDSIPEQQQTGMGYTVSKNFVQWYTKKMALRYGKKGIRVVSISPGTFNTPMGEVEGEEAASFALAGAMGRLGEPEEIAKMMAFMVSDECSYLDGVDILYDGGAVCAVEEMMAQRAAAAGK
ncbi:MAG: SDR family oxidoreductase [Oscillospiraceae bacterium]|nr:SDR family oxidoreductase [Oscillospiraceae bacterium]